MIEILRVLTQVAAQRNGESKELTEIYEAAKKAMENGTPEEKAITQAFSDRVKDLIEFRYTGSEKILQMHVKVLGIILVHGGHKKLYKSWLAAYNLAK